MNNLIKAAQDVLKAWDSAKAYNIAPTADAINKLRQALADHIVDSNKMVSDYEKLKQERDRYRKALDDIYQYHQFESAFKTRNEVRDILIKALK